MVIFKMYKIKFTTLINVHVISPRNLKSIILFEVFMVTEAGFAILILVNVPLMGNIIRQPSLSVEFKQFSRMDPEALKKMGNVAYKKGGFKEALTFYERAIFLDSKQATYRCNKSAALLRLGRVLEAVVECKEVVQLDPTYCRSYHRLATIYLRLGEAKQALNHYKQAGNLTDSNGIAKSLVLFEVFMVIEAGLTSLKSLSPKRMIDFKLSDER